MKSFLNSVLLSILFFTNTLQAQELFPFPDIPGRTPSDKYVYRVRQVGTDEWKDAFVFQTICKNNPDENNSPTDADNGYFKMFDGGSSSYIAFEFSGISLDVEISKVGGAPITKAMVMSIGHASAATIANGKAYIVFDKPANVNVHGTIHPEHAWGNDASKNWSVYGSGTICGENILWSGDENKSSKTFTYQTEVARMEGFVVYVTKGTTLMELLNFKDIKLIYHQAYCHYWYGASSFTVEKNLNIKAIFSFPTRTSNRIDPPFNIYPNRATEKLYINFPIFDVKKIQYVDLTGKLVYEAIPVSQNESIDISGFISGLYNIGVYTSDDIIT